MRLVACLLLMLVSIHLSNSFIYSNNIKQLKLITNRSIVLYGKRKKSNQLPPTPEFSRIINISQLQLKKPVLCRLLAKPTELANLAERFDIPELTKFGANVTVSFQDHMSIQVKGSIEAHLKYLETETVKSNFDTLILNNIGEEVDLEDAPDYDEEVASNGDIDIGEIAAQYLALELY